MQMAGLLQWSEEEMMATRNGAGAGGLAVRREVFGFWVHFVDRFRIEVGL